MDVLILHGWNLSGKKYSKLSNFLTKKGHRVFAPDLPGFGNNPTPEHALSLFDYVLFVSDFIVKHRIHKPLIIGQSFGGRVAILLASDHPKLAKRIILTGVPGFRSDRGGKVKILLALSRVGSVLFSFPIIRNAKGFARKMLYKGAGVHDYYHIIDDSMRATFKNIIDEDLVNPMKKMETPTHLIWGEDDTITPVWIAEKMAKIIAKSRLSVIDNASHSVVYKQPERFITAIKIH